MNKPIIKAMLMGQVLLLAMLTGWGWAAALPPAATPGAVEKSLQTQPLPQPARLPEIKIEGKDEAEMVGGAISTQLKSVVFEGNTVYSSDQLQRVIAGFIGQTMEVSKLAKVAYAITAYYKGGDFFLTAAYIPPQTIKDGRLLIKIREARLGDIIVQGNKRYSRELINNTLQVIRKAGAIRLADVERALLLLMDKPGLSVQATFKPGRLPATSDIVLDVTEGRWIDFGLDYDNFGSRFISQNRYGASLNLNNLTGYGDALNLHQVTGDGGFNKLSYSRLAYELPVGYNGTKIGINYNYMKYKLGKELEVLDAGGEVNGGSLWASHPLVRSRNFNWYLQGGLNLNNVTQTIAGMEVGKDNIRYANLGTTWQWFDSFAGNNTVSFRVNRSFENILGGTDKGSTSMIRTNSDIAYTKLEMDLTRIQRLPAGFSLLLNGTGQWSSDRLPSSEQFHLGGAGTVRGYAQAERSGDTGLAATAEFRIPFFGLQNQNWFGRPVGEMLQLAAFYDYGKVWITNAAQNGEQALDAMEMHGAGAGVRFSFSPYARFKVDWAKSVGGVSPRDDSDKSGIWLAQLVLSF